MKSLTLPLLGLLTAPMLLMGACKKDEPALSNAVIVYDPRMCPCCGGLVVDFTNTPKFAGVGTYSIANSADLNIDVKELPLYVRVSWVTEPNGCSPTARITKLERR
ncbi:hypothetical protein E4631_02460 [Hymenobacter sp. UV11]|uniref:hypothetical protein n=1 Tax=Hymenobacter sp. UV11 TaxID=1849735 RepID=UPI001101B30A|nr:hypothetical protein [Hymenobacter sp. UV11]TFZ68942.1 hypothetical protein E4631_02460 [Hymenobacter sp. UV11]